MPSLGSYVPQQRLVKMEFLTQVGWIRGTLHLPARSLLVDHLNHSREFIPMTDVSFDNQAQLLKFFAVHRDHVVLATAADDEFAVFQPKAETTSYQVSCLLERGSVYGTLDLLKGVRTSDFFAHQRGFVSFKSCEAIIGDRWGESVQQYKYKEIFVGARHIIGIADIRADEG